jgi:hypothetical protein
MKNLKWLLVMLVAACSTKYDYPADKGKSFKEGCVYGGGAGRQRGASVGRRWWTARLKGAAPFADGFAY